MKKRDKSKFELKRRRSEKKTLKRRKKNSVYQDPFVSKYNFNEFLFKHDQIIIDNSKHSLNDFLNKNFLDSKTGIKQVITIPKIFSLEHNQIECFEIIDQIRKSILKNKGSEVRIDFTKCNKVDYGCLFLLKVIVDEYLTYLGALQRKLRAINVITKVFVSLSSTSQDVNNRLIACQIIAKPTDAETKFLPISAFNLIKGSKPKKSYLINKKAQATIAIRLYINESLQRHNVELDERGKSYLDGIISEVLNNAEDHSPFDTWYAAGNLFETRLASQDEIIGEVNLAFLNFGYSIYQGFEDTKAANYDIYSQMEALYNLVINKYPNLNIGKEQFYTLYALQDGFSRLSYKEPSRGTGTMKFIKSFIDLGDYQNKEENIVPNLLIYSGRTMLKCDHDLRPFDDNGVNYLSLNKENKMTLPPEETHLKNSPTLFPGTLLVVKIYLNRTNLMSKIV